MIQSYRDLKVWQVGMDLVEETYRVTRCFPRDEVISIALGSLAELETQLLVAVRLGYVDDSGIRSALSMADSTGRMLRSLQKTLRSKLSPSP